MKDEAFPYRGRCLCGTIQYEARNISSRIGHCHCSMCRKFHGAAFATFADFQRKDFRWLEGESALKAYKAENGTTRHFCKHCGSSMTFQSSTPDDTIIELALGTLDTPIPHRPDAHIYVASKADWDEIGGDLPCYEAGRDSEAIK